MDLVKKLHPLEVKVLPHVSKQVSLQDLCTKTGLKDVEVTRAVQWLANKELVSLTSSSVERICLDANGKLYLEKGMPERRFLAVLHEDKALSLTEVQNLASLSQQEVGISLGALKKKAAVTVMQGNDGITIQRTSHGTSLLTSDTLEERFLQELPVLLSALTDEQRFAFDTLKQRKAILKLETTKHILVALTSLGKDVQAAIASMPPLLDRVTHTMLKDTSWKDKEFRHYDIGINVPRISGGKRHFVHQAIEYIRSVWLELGFKEMEGTMVQSAFWDLDALFVPQDHPARAMQDTFYLADPSVAQLPTALVKKVKKTHEQGGDTGSAGWGGLWDEKEASRTMLRTHTTVLSAQTIARLTKADLPAKFFCVGKVFRNEMLSWKHLFEFHQVEGIVIDPNATLQHLKGYLRAFYKKLGFSDIRMRPAHFPYTEPSLEVDVFHPTRKEWIELGGAGIFRPEVVKPLLGIDVPVLAWGQGLERGIMDYYGFKDIRQLYDNDLAIHQEVKVWK